jgi:hypothetical protein
MVRQVQKNSTTPAAHLRPGRARCSANADCYSDCYRDSFSNTCYTDCYGDYGSYHHRRRGGARFAGARRFHRALAGRT